jgi:hypothetical protein
MPPSGVAWCGQVLSYAHHVPPAFVDGHRHTVDVDRGGLPRFEIVGRDGVDEPVVVRHTFEASWSGVRADLHRLLEGAAHDQRLLLRREVLHDL